MKGIKMVDLAGQYVRLQDEINRSVAAVLSSGSFIQGPPVDAFCSELAGYLDSSFVIPCGSGTDALQIAIMALNLSPGDEVIMPSFTYAATAEVVALLGLVPVFVDVDENSFTIDVNQLEDAISRRTRAIIPVHLFGQCAEMEQINLIAQKYGIPLVEDVAQAIGAEYKLSDGSVLKAGTIGLIGALSFFPSKNLGAYGDGGAILTDVPELAEKLRMIANHGQKVKYHHELIGVNSRLDSIQAAILSVKLKYLDEFIEARNRAARYYDQHLPKSLMKLPFRSINSTHVFHQYTCKIIDSDREGLLHFLEERDIPAMVYYPLPLHLQKAFSTFSKGRGAFPVSERLADTVVSLPIHTEMTEEQLSYICQTIKDYNG